MHKENIATHVKDKDKDGAGDKYTPWVAAKDKVEAGQGTTYIHGSVYSVHIRVYASVIHILRAPGPLMTKFTLRPSTYTLPG